MKKIIIATIFLISGKCFAQVDTVYTKLPLKATQLNGKAVELSLPNATSTASGAISSPAEGLLVYVTNTDGTFTAKGWWGWDGAAWQKLNN